MQKNLEEEMAKALEGQFFWEKTTKYEDSTCLMTVGIRRSQREFAKSAARAKKTSSKVKLNPVKERLESQKNIPDTIRKVKIAIMKHYNLTEFELEGGEGSKRIFPARCHYIWAVLKYNPSITKAGFGREIGKHHSTIIHHERLFEDSKHMFRENIEAVEKIIGYKPE